MRIAINGRFLTRPHTGIGVYTRQLFSAFAGEFPDSEIMMVTPAAPPPELHLPANIRIVTVPERFPGTGGMKKTYWEQVQVPAAIAKSAPDLIHFPYPSNPWRARS